MENSTIFFLNPSLSNDWVFAGSWPVTPHSFFFFSNYLIFFYSISFYFMIFEVFTHELSGNDWTVRWTKHLFAVSNRKTSYDTVVPTDCCGVYCLHCVLDSEWCCRISTFILGLTYMNAIIIRVTKENKKVKWIFLFNFIVWKRLFSGNLLANNNLFARTLPYICPESLIRKCV